MGRKLPIYAERILTLRKSRELTQEQVSQKIGCDIKSYRSWELGKTLPRTELLISLSKLFGVSTDYILGLIEYTHIGNKEVSEITGLSQRATDTLRQINSSPEGKLYPLVLSRMVDSSFFVPLIGQIRYYAGKVEQIKERWTPDDRNAINADSFTLRAEKFGVTDVFSDLLDDLVPLPDKKGCK